MRLIGILNNDLRITFADEKQYELLCKSILKDKGDCRVSVEIKRFSGSKTMRQLGYYYGVVLPTIMEFQCEDYTERNRDKLHYELKEMFFFIESINTFSKKPQREVKSLSGADISEMSEYIDKVVRFANTELNIVVPSSEEYWSN